MLAASQRKSSRNTTPPENNNDTSPPDTMPAANYVSDDAVDGPTGHSHDGDGDGDYSSSSSNESYRGDNDEDIEELLLQSQNSFSALVADSNKDNNNGSSGHTNNNKSTTRTVKFANLGDEPPERLASRTPYHQTNSNSSSSLPTLTNDGHSKSDLQELLINAQIALSSEKTLRIRKEKNVVSLAKELESRNATIKNKEAQIIKMAKRLHELEKHQQSSNGSVKSQLTGDESTASTSSSSSDKAYRARYSELMREHVDVVAAKDAANTKLSDRLALLEQEVKRYESDAKIQSTRLTQAEQRCRTLTRDQELRLRSMQAQYDHKMDDLLMDHTGALQKKSDEIAQLTVKVLDLETRLKDDVDSLKKRHKVELKQVMDSLKARHSSEITDVDTKLHAELVTKDETIRKMKDKQFTDDEKIRNAQEQIATLQKRLDEELQKSDATCSDIDVRMAKLIKDHQDTVASMAKQFKAELHAKEALVKSMAERANEAENSMHAVKGKGDIFQHEIATLYQERDNALLEVKTRQESFTADLKRERQSFRISLEEKEKEIEEITAKKQKLEHGLNESRAETNALSQQIEQMLLDHKKDMEEIHAKLQFQQENEVVETSLTPVQQQRGSVCAEYEESLTSTVANYESQIVALKNLHQQDIQSKVELMLQHESRIDDLDLTVLSLKEKLRLEKGDNQVGNSPDSAYEDRISKIESDYSQAFNDLEQKHKVELSDKSSQVESLSKSMADLVDEKETLQNKINALDAQKADLMAKIGQLEEEQNHTTPDLSNLDKDAEALMRTCSKLQSDLDQACSMIEEKEAEIEDYEEELQKLQTEVSNLSYLLDEARVDVEKYDDETVSLSGEPRARFQSADTETNEKVHEKERELEKALEIVAELTEKLSQSKTSSDKYVEEVETMKKDYEDRLKAALEKHRADALNMDKLKLARLGSADKSNAEVDRMLGNVSAGVTLLQKEVTATRNECNERLAAMKVEYETTLSEVTLTHERELENKTREAQEATTQVKGLKESLEYAQGEISRLKKDASNTRDNRDEHVTSMRKSHKKMYDRQADDLAKASIQVADLTRKLDVARGEARRFCEQISSLRQDYDKKVEDMGKEHEVKLAELENENKLALEEKSKAVERVKTLLHETQDRLQMTREESEIYQRKMLELAGKRRSSCKNIRTKLTSVTSEMESACSNIEEQQYKLNSVSLDSEKVTSKLRDSEEKLSAAIEEVESQRVKIHELESDLAESEKVKKKPRSRSWATTFLAFLGLVGLLSAVSAAALVFYRADALVLDYMCSPVQPGTVVTGGDIYFEAPWWAPEELKESAFSTLCSQRSRSKFAFSTLSGGKFSVYSVNGTETELMWRKAGARAVIGHDRVLITDRKHNPKHEIHFPWRF